MQNYCEDGSTANAGSKPVPETARKTTSSTRRRDKATPIAIPISMDETVVTKTVRGFSDAEIRRFIKSYRKFGEPRTRFVL